MRIVETGDWRLELTSEEDLDRAPIFPSPRFPAKSLITHKPLTSSPNNSKLRNQFGRLQRHSHDEHVALEMKYLTERNKK